MTSRRPSLVASPGAVALGAALVVITAWAWVVVIRGASSMSMPESGVAPSIAAGATFTFQWGVMMAAMMLPSAAPMILLYRTVSRRLSAAHERSIPVAMFAAVYLFLWLLLGIPVYGASIMVDLLAARWPGFEAAIPYGVAGVLFTAGVYQFTGAKRTCLRYCESPLAFLMNRWQSGYAATLRLAVHHAGYCIGCCWALMVILVAAGAMSTAWVLSIALIVFAEKVLPHGWRTARLVGMGLIALGLAVALRPQLAARLKPGAGSMGSMSIIHRTAGPSSGPLHLSRSGTG